jgi:hypothetical protein
MVLQLHRLTIQPMFSEYVVMQADNDDRSQRKFHLPP